MNNSKPFNYEDKSGDSFQKPKEGFNLTEKELDLLFSALKTQTRNPRHNKHIMMSGKELTITDENGMIGFCPLP